MTCTRLIKNKILKEIYRWCMGALDAFNKEYLEELYLIFMGMSDPYEILESYKFRFEYDKCRREVTVDSKILKSAVCELFTSISEISVDPLKENNFVPYICINYTDNVPPTYHAPHFNSAHTEHRLAKFLESKCKNYMKCRRIDTGFHSMSYECNLPGWQPDLNKNVECIDLTLEDDDEVVDTSILKDDVKLNTSMEISDYEGPLEQDHQTNLNDSFKTDDSVTICLSQENCIDYLDKINCPCALKKKFFNIDLVECNRCHLMQHLPCIGYLFENEFDSAYNCDKCKNVALTYTDHLLSSLRLLVAHSYFNSSFAFEVFDEMKLDIKPFMIRILLLHKAVEYVDNKYVIGEDIGAFVEWLFTEGDQNIFKWLHK
ncbi:hypothetical protein FQR65_LT08659 [Abscondita terminalis]|nr:hypothetical protein FQR65_LT08659 [Abscondita terminalis]